MFSTSGSGGPGMNPGIQVADGETVEVRDVQVAAAASWACERGPFVDQEDSPPAALAHFG